MILEIDRGVLLGVGMVVGNLVGMVAIWLGLWDGFVEFVGEGGVVCGVGVVGRGVCV